MTSRHRLALSNKVVMQWLRCRRTPAGHGLTGLAVTGVGSGRVYRFPVLAATDDGTHPKLVVLPSHPPCQSWWRNLDQSGDPVELQVLDRGAWRAATATVLRPEDPAFASALTAYTDRWPTAEVGDGPLVAVALARVGAGLGIAYLRHDRQPASAGATEQT